MYKRIPKSLASVGLLLAGGLLFASCDKGVTDPNDRETAPINFTAYAVGTPVNTIVIEVTASDIQKRLVFNLELVEGVANGILEVPVGDARTFTVTAFDDHHNVTHEGSATADVNPGSNPPLQVKLKPTVGEVDITVTFGDYAVLVTPPSATIDASVSNELQLEVTVVDQYGEEVPDPQVRWATTHPTLATVDANGLVTGLADGPATIVATYAGVAGLCEITLTGFGGGLPLPPGWQPQSSQTTVQLNAVWGSSARDVWAVGAYGTVMHYDGTAWSAGTSGTEEHLFGVWGVSPSDVWAVGYNGTIIHYDGNTWGSQDSGGTDILLDVGGTSATDVWVTANSGNIYHYKGNTWSFEPSGQQYALTDIWAYSPSDVFVAGSGGNVLNYDGANWLHMISPTYQGLFGIWGTSPGNVWVVGGHHYIGNWYGAGWYGAEGDTSDSLYDIWGSSENDVFAVGENGFITHWGGAAWTEMNSGVVTDLFGVWGSSSSDVFAVGSDGTTIHYDGG